MLRRNSVTFLVVTAGGFVLNYLASLKVSQMKISIAFPRYRAALSVIAIALPSLTCAGQYEDAMLARDRGDFSAAFRSFKQLASSGDANSQFQLSMLYTSGKGATADNKQALYWLKQAATHGQVMAQSNLGVAFNMGRVIPQDIPKAYAWLSIAAISGDSVATTNRDVVARKLTANQLERAKALAQTCLSGNFTPCL
jgi:hypothetical protein